MDSRSILKEEPAGFAERLHRGCEGWKSYPRGDREGCGGQPGSDVLRLRCLRRYCRAPDEGARERSLEFKKTGGTRLGVASLRTVFRTRDYEESES